ncbi:MAG: zinc ribbon domain-containing protein [Cyanobacteria bacterium HKST-UBA02]|nr:zinc ribbon domain-containing protein [Cyanobacteria bacterium HKST-UBA02]
MPSYDYRCLSCRETFTVERSMKDSPETSCELCGSEQVSRIWNMYIAAGVRSTESETSSRAPARSGGGCGSCCGSSCGSCH